jgi:Bacterial SH3 domain
MGWTVKLAVSAAVALSLAACSAATDDNSNGLDETAALSDELSGGVPDGTHLQTTANLNLRTGPSLGNAVILVIPAGTEVTAVDGTPHSGFYHVKYGSHEGYSYGAYLTKVSNGGGGSNGGGDTGAVTRALGWVSAKVPYCGGSNGGHDYICGGTCYRPHEAWDAWRSDCSGLVSWSWGLPAPGRTTGGFAPFDTAASYTINATDLQPGDAVNNSHHIMLFWHWVNKSTGTAAFIEESDCGLNALTRTFTFSMSGDKITMGNGDGRVFYAIRKR